MHPHLAYLAVHHGPGYYGISSNPHWWIIGAIFALVVGFVMAGRSKSTA
jgi:hypothetical protein